MIVDLLKQLEADPDGLLHRISRHIDDEMLEWISTADYGSRADEQLVALRQVRDTGTFPADMSWCPAEVMELIRWSEPEDSEWKPGRTGEFGHWMRAFCCAALLRATRQPWNYGDGLATDSTVVQMTLSLCALPVDFTADAIRFLAWLLIHSDPEERDEQVCAYAVCLLWFALRQPSPFADDELISLARWIFENSDELYDSPTFGGNNGLREMVTLSMKKSSWEMLALKFLDLDMTSRLNALRVWVRAIGEQMLE